MSPWCEIISISAIAALLGLAGFTFRWDRSAGGLFLSAALMMTALLELLDLCSLTVAPESACFWKQRGIFAESLLPPLWILCSLTYAREKGWKNAALWVKVAVVASTLPSIMLLFIPVDSFFFAPDFPAEKILFLADVGYFFYIGIIAALLFSLIHFETTLTHAPPVSLWKIKYTIVGFGTILMVLVLYFSHAFLYRSLNMSFLTLRSFMYLIGAALITYSYIRRRDTVKIEISRHIAYKSMIVFLIGGYLITLGLFGEGMKYVDTDLTRYIIMAICFLVGLLLLILLLSSRIRREIKVFLHKNFYKHKHDYRTQWLHFTGQLATSVNGNEIFQHILREYCNLFGISGAALFLYETGCEGYCVVSSYEMGSIHDVISPDNKIIRYMKESTWVINVKEECNEKYHLDIAVFRKYGISFLVPLLIGDRLEGFIVLGRVVKTNEVFIYEDYDLMKTIARQASVAIMHHLLSEEVSLGREIKAINNVATFVVHDLKNLVSNLLLIVENADRHIRNPDFQRDMLASLSSTASKMQRLIGSLKNMKDGESYSKQQVNLLELAHNSARTFSGSTVMVTGSPEIVHVNEDEIQKVIFNLILNAIEASGPDEPVRVEAGFSGTPYISVTDSGCGMSNRYMHSELFKPFRSTKKDGLGIGLYQCRLIVEAHGGTLEAQSVEGEGSIFTVRFENSVSAQGLVNGKASDN